MIMRSRRTKDDRGDGLYIVKYLMRKDGTTYSQKKSMLKIAKQFNEFYNKDMYPRPQVIKIKGKTSDAIEDIFGQER